MGKSNYQVVLLRNNSSNKKTLNLNRFKIFSVLSIILILTGCAIYFTGSTIAEYMTGKAMSEVVKENNELKAELEVINQRVNDFSEKLTRLYESDDRLRLMADMPRIDTDTRQVGVGGNVNSEVKYAYDNKKINQLIYDLDKLEREIKLQRSSFTEIHRQMKENADLIAHTPSIRPIKGGYVSSWFGYRKDPFTGKRAHHNGIDYSVEKGTPIAVSANGKVIFSRAAPGMGKTVIVDHGYGWRTCYGHMSRILVRKGQTVVRGQKIGEVGNTGRSTGPHLHYEVQVERKAVNPIDYLYDDFAVRPVD